MQLSCKMYEITQNTNKSLSNIYLTINLLSALLWLPLACLLSSVAWEIIDKDTLIVVYAAFFIPICYIGRLYVLRIGRQRLKTLRNQLLPKDFKPVVEFYSTNNLTYFSVSPSTDQIAYISLPDNKLIIRPRDYLMGWQHRIHIIHSGLLLRFRDYEMPQGGVHLSIFSNIPNKIAKMELALED